MYGGKFAFQNRLGYLVVGRKFTIFALFYFVFERKFQVQASLRSKRFRLVSEQRKTEERYSRFWPREK